MKFRHRGVQLLRAAQQISFQGQHNGQSEPWNMGIFIHQANMTDNKQ